MKDFYISFGQAHAHSISGKTLDKDTIAVISADNKRDAHEIAMKAFNGVFCFVYEEKPDMSFFPKGLVRI